MNTLKKPAVVINANAGTTTDISDDITKIFQNRFGLTPQCHYVTGDNLVDAIDSAVSFGADLIVTYGGDGTSLAAVEAANTSKIPVVALPGGTMNLLPRSLYGTDNWEAALNAALSQQTPNWIATGSIDDKVFVVAAMIGTIVRMGVTRELVREGDILEATKTLSETLQDVSPQGGFNYKTDGGEYEFQANLLQVTCPFMNEFAKKPDAFDVIGINVGSYAELSTLGFSAMFNEWRSNKAATATQSKTINVLGSGNIDVLLDGEHSTLELPLKIMLKKQGALFLCPAQNF